MGATFSRVKNWVAELLTYADLNAEIDSILSNLTPAGVDDYSANATAMRVDTDPGESGTESLATSLQGELERLRYAIREIKGSGSTGVSYWYETADTSLAEIASSLGSTLIANRIASGKMRTGSSQPLFLTANGAAKTIALNGASTNFVYFVAGVQYTISTNITATSLTAAPSSNNTCLVNLPLLAGQSYSKMLGEYGSTIQVDNMGSGISALIGSLAAFKVAGAATEYFIGRVDSATQISNCRRGYFFDSTDAPVARTTISDNDTITLMKLTWVYATTAGALAVGYTPPTVGADEPVSPAIGDYWYDTSASVWKYYSGTWAASASTLVGCCIQDATNCVAARGFDFFKNHSATSTAQVVRSSATVCLTQNSDSEVSIYGTNLKFFPGRLSWDTAVDFDSGVSEAASTNYFLYLKETGERIISDLAPHDRTADLKGLYHPYHTWRCLGSVYNNTAQDFVACIDYQDTSPTNYKVVNAVASSALTVTVLANPLSKIRVNSVNTTDLVETVQIPCSSFILIASGSTLGQTSNLACNLYVGLLSDFGAPNLVISSQPLGCRGLLTSTAEAGNGDSLTALYGLRALTTKPAARLATFSSTQATAGTWATALADNAQAPGRVGVSRQAFTSSTGIYTTPLGVSYIRVRMCGGGGGGSGSGTASATNGTAGTQSAFGSTTCAGGGAGVVQSAGIVGGAASLGTGHLGIAIIGGTSGGYEFTGATTNAVKGGDGGRTPFFDGGGIGYVGAGVAGITNTGGGGAGGGCTSGTANNYSGTGGGSGGFADFYISNPVATYSYEVGSAGGNGAAGTNGLNGAAGGSGYIEVYEFYE